MNQLAKREGSPAKRLLLKRKKAMEINEADVAELVDARDLKFFAVVESPHLFCITRPQITIETDGTRRDLHNMKWPPTALRRSCDAALPDSK
jgi:hypothetical protein